MECRIEVLEEGGVRTVTVAGQLADEHVPDLFNACGTNSTTLLIDLSDIQSVDAIAVEALRRLRTAGARFRGVRQYIQLKLDSADEPSSPY